MHKLPSLLLVGITAGIAGAGLMWLLMREDPGARFARIADQARDSGASSRIGIAESYPSQPEFEAAASGAKRVDAKVLGNLATQSADAARIEAPESPAAQTGNQNIAALPSFPADRSQPGVLPGQGPARPRVFSTHSAEAKALEDALSVALEAAIPYVKEGFTAREDYWGGTVGRKPKAVTHQLFRGNEYWFWAGTDNAETGIEVHVYDSDGNLAESEYWHRENAGAARVIPARTGTYYLIVSQRLEDETKDERQTHWALAYGYR
jgi:hypothetical protein